MKLLLWCISINHSALAKIHWLLYKWFGITKKTACGRTKQDSYLCCCLSPNKENSIVINNEETHEIICKVCGSIHVMSNTYLDFDNMNKFEEW